jgi:hypothetical protein
LGGETYTATRDRLVVKGEQRMKLVKSLCAVVAMALALAPGMFVSCKGSPGSAAYAAAARQPSAEAAIKSAVAKHRYAVVTFYKKSANQGLMKRDGLAGAPTPLTLVIAPNGAVTGGITGTADAAKITSAFASDGMASVLKVLQSGKLALVCVQNGRTRFNGESMKAATAFKADSRLPGAVEIVKIDPSNRGEAKFLGMCKVEPSASNAQIVMIVPPGRILGRFEGQTTKDTMYASLQTALKSSGCTPGSGCCPK